MKQLLIAGRKDSTQNYESAFSTFSIELHTSILSQNAKDILAYDALLLPGGGDIDTELDNAQFRILDLFVEAQKPVLGISKGMQLINLYFGGTLIQNLGSSSLNFHYDSMGDTIHQTFIPAFSFLHGLYGPCPIVNSAHHQALGSIGTGLKIHQYSPDFVVEGIRHEKLPIIGVQWNPERLCPPSSTSLAINGQILLEYFLNLLDTSALL